MKIIHFSDTHLGFNDLDILNGDNINLREADFYDAFIQVAEAVKTKKPDYLIHTGDLFHRASPSNRAITFALEQFKILEDLDIPFILIAGNHSTPRTNLSSPILKIFENFKNVHVAYKQRYEKFEFKDVVFHCIPHINNEEAANKEIDKAEESIDPNRKNVLMLHCSVGAWYLMEEFGEWVYPGDRESLFPKMDYVALGHWHGFKQVGKHENVFYSGSTERTGKDRRNKKGFIQLALEEELEVAFKPIEVREFISFEIDCSDYEEALRTLEIGEIKEKIVDVKLTNLTVIKSIDISNKEIRDLFKEAVYVSVKREFIKEEGGTIDVDESVSLEEYFLEHIKEESEAGEFERLEGKIKELFSHYEEAESDS